MNNYDKNIESSDVEFLDANNLYGWVMSKKLPVMVLNGWNSYQNLMKNS